MKKLLSILLLAVTIFYLPNSAAAIKCWTNHDGVRECGNVIPPEYAQKETRTLNERGVTTEIRARAKTRTEIMEERRLAEKQQLKASEEREKKEQQQAIDRALLSTFLKGEEIIAARDRKLAVFDSYLDMSLISIGKLKEKLEDAQKSVANREGNGQPVSDASKAEIRSIRNQISVKEGFIRQKESEKEQLRKKYDADYERFMVLKRQRR